MRNEHTYNLRKKKDACGKCLHTINRFRIYHKGRCFFMLKFVLRFSNQEELPYYLEKGDITGEVDMLSDKDRLLFLDRIAKKEE